MLLRTLNTCLFIPKGYILACQAPSKDEKCHLHRSFPLNMPKRSREESLIASTPDSASLGSDTPSPASTDTPAHSVKYVHTSDEPRSNQRIMKCSLPPHAEVLAFDTFEEFEVHYEKVHAHRCSECRQNFPTEHFLGLHISENHDPLNEARRARGEKTVRRTRCFLGEHSMAGGCD